MEELFKNSQNPITQLVYKGKLVHSGNIIKVLAEVMKRVDELTNENQELKSILSNS